MELQSGNPGCEPKFQSVVSKGEAVATSTLKLPAVLSIQIRQTSPGLPVGFIAATLNLHFCYNYSHYYF
jgi:hypothetical protein